MPKESHIALEKFIESAQESSRRVRRMLIIVTATSVVIAAAGWTALKDSLGRGLLQQKASNLAQLWVDDFLNPEDSAAQALATAKVLGTIESKLLEEYLAHLVFEMPFFGVRFHLEDLGLVGGATTLSVTLLLMVSARREWLNYVEVFKRASDENSLECCYRLLAMSQVYSETPEPGARCPTWKRIPSKIFFVGPFFVHLGLVLPAQYLYLEEVYGDSLKRLEFFVSCAALLLIATVAFLAARYSWRCDDTWLTRAREISSKTESPCQKEAT